MARGLAVFCEKPLAPDLAGAQAMAAVVERSGVPAQVGLVLRYAPVFRALRDVLASGELGDPMTAVFRDDQYFPVQGVYASAWRGDVAVAGGGCLIEHSIHDLDILRFCLGEVTGVTGRTENFSGHEGVEDLATVSLRFVSGASAELVSVWHDISSRGSTRRVEVFCRNGMAWLDNDFLGPLYVQSTDGTEVRPCPPPGWVSDLELGDDEIGLAMLPMSRPTGRSSTPCPQGVRRNPASPRRSSPTDWSTRPTVRRPPAGCRRVRVSRASGRRA